MSCRCGECRTVHEGVAAHYTWEQREAANARPVFLGRYTKPDWDGHERLYLFKCRSCYQARTSFVCYTTADWFNIPHLHCSWCSRDPYVIADYAVYRELGMDDPPSGWDRFMYEVKMFFRKSPRCRGEDSRP